MASMICSYCALPKETVEDEHVFPKSWYPDASAPVGRPIVPSCPECNREYGRLEERLQRHWALCLDPHDPAVRGVPERVRRSLNPRFGKSPRDAAARGNIRTHLIDSVRIIPSGEPGAFPGLTGRPDRWRRRNGGLYVRGAPALRLPASDVQAFTRKLVRGLFVHDFGIRLPRDFHIDTFVITEAAWQRERARIAAWGIERRGVPPGFDYWAYVESGQPLDSLWYFQIWGTIRLQAATLFSEQVAGLMDG